MGRGFRTKGGWTFDTLVRAVKIAGGGPYRLLPMRERRRVLSLLAGLPKRGAENSIHSHRNHAASSDCSLCRAECVAIGILDWRARTCAEVVSNAA